MKVKPGVKSLRGWEEPRVHLWICPCSSQHASQRLSAVVWREQGPLCYQECTESGESLCVCSYTPCKYVCSEGHSFTHKAADMCGYAHVSRWVLCINVMYVYYIHTHKHVPVLHKPSQKNAFTCHLPPWSLLPFALLSPEALLRSQPLTVITASC